MTTTKQRLDEKINVVAKSYQSNDDIEKLGPASSYRYGSNLLAPLLLEMVESLKYYQGYEHHSAVADDAINKFEDFIDAN
jgi:hypothetical protein